ncbi:MAG: hypothetical protein ACM31L_15595 [Actinomycetota bacterium]
MSDMELTGDSPELVAYRLALDVQDLEGRFRSTEQPYSRAEFLDLYAECLEAVGGGRKVKDRYRRP